MKNTTLLILSCLAIISCETGLKSSEPKEPTNTSAESSHQVKRLETLPKFVIDTLYDDRDNSRYATIQIGKQVWIKGMIKYHDKKLPSNQRSLYNWEEAKAACPSSLMIPSEDDWNTLFRYVYDSVIRRSSPALIEALTKNDKYDSCPECRGIIRESTGMRFYELDATIQHLQDFDYDQFVAHGREEEKLISLFLEQIGFCIYGTGFKVGSTMGIDDYAYFWTSTKDKVGDSKYMPIITGDYCQGCGYSFSMPYNNKSRYNLKCLKKS